MGVSVWYGCIDSGAEGLSDRWMAYKQPLACCRAGTPTRFAAAATQTQCGVDYPLTVFGLSLGRCYTFGYLTGRHVAKL